MSTMTYNEIAEQTAIYMYCYGVANWVNNQQGTAQEFAIACWQHGFLLAANKQAAIDALTPAVPSPTPAPTPKPTPRPTASPTQAPVQPR